MYDRIKTMLEESINDIFLRLQEENNIESGDVSPEWAYELNHDTGLVAMCINNIVQSQMNPYTVIRNEAYDILKESDSMTKVAEYLDLAVHAGDISKADMEMILEDLNDCEVTA